MTSDTTTKHTKHAKLTRPALGTFARTELAILGTPCGYIKTLAYDLIRQLRSDYRVAYVDADHKGEETPEAIPALSAGATAVFTDKISFKRLDLNRALNDFQQKAFFNDYDLVLVNGNHFTAQVQIAVVDPAKPLDKKLDRLTDVRLLVLKDTDTVPDYLQNKVPPGVPVVRFDETGRILDVVKTFLTAQRPPLLGLVLTGGKSTRMGRDKATLDYHGRPQREYLTDLLAACTDEVFWSVNAAQRAELPPTGPPVIQDAFLGLGPMGGMLSAFQQRPDAAWLVVACDLPLLSARSLDVLVAGRNPSKLATAFMDPDNRFPEPLISIWEPRAYPTLLQFLALGYSCPRKVLINSEVQLLTAPDVSELTNVNDPVGLAAVKQLLE